jgi:hypothetical protein
MPYLKHNPIHRTFKVDLFGSWQQISTALRWLFHDCCLAELHPLEIRHQRALIRGSFQPSDDADVKALLVLIQQKVERADLLRYSQSRAEYDLVEQKN